MSSGFRVWESSPVEGFDTVDDIHPALPPALPIMRNVP